MILLIADDEDNIREGLRDNIDWNQLGFDQILTAENGVEAWGVYNKFSPDLIITDIKMPGMSGLELSKQIKENHGGPEIIILSGYSEFEYAREAIDLEVLHYHIKPVNLNKLGETVNRAIQKIVARKKMAEDLSQQSHMLIQNDLADFLAGNMIDTESVELIFNNFNSQSKLSLLTIVLEREEAFAETRTGVPVEKLLENVLTTWLSGKEHITHNRDPFYTVIYENIFTLSSRRNRQSIILLKQKLDFTFAGIGTGFSISYTGSSDYSGMPDLYRTSLSLLDHRLYLGTGSLIMGDEQSNASQPEKKIDWFPTIELELIDCIRSFDSDSCGTILAKTMDSLKEQKCISYDIVTNNCIRFRNTLVRTLNLSPERHGHFLTGDLSFFTEIPQLITIEQYKDWIISIYSNVLHRMRKLSGVRHFSEMNQAVKYIHEHYTEQIAIETIARQVQLHPDHFSRLFKKEMGIAFSKYVNTVRIGHAKKMLQETNLLAYEVASQTGFRNYKYFVQVFKDLEGYSPSKLRR